MSIKGYISKACPRVKLLSWGITVATTLQENSMSATRTQWSCMLKSAGLAYDDNAIIQIHN